MISAINFVNLWTKTGEKLVFPPEKAVNQLLIPKIIKTWLIKAGLPEEAAPFLSFGPQGSKGWFPNVSTLFQLTDEYSVYRVIGCNGSGDPICIDESENGVIILLHHDEDFRQIFLNSSIPQLAESLLYYREFVNYIIQEKGENAYLEGDIPLDVKAQTIRDITQNDKMAMKSGSFWAIELQEFAMGNQ
jgi:hypothetical protein